MGGAQLEVSALENVRTYVHLHIHTDTMVDFGQMDSGMLKTGISGKNLKCKKFHDSNTSLMYKKVETLILLE